MKIKICFIAPKAYQLFEPTIKSTFGGAEVQLYLLATELAGNDNLSVHFMVADYGQQAEEIRAGVTLWKALDFKRSLLLQVLSFFRVFNRIRADVYIQRTLTPQSGLIALYCKLIKKKFIYMVAHDREADSTHELFRKPLGRLLAHLNFKYASAIIVQNNYEKDLLAEKYSAEKISMLKKGVKVSEFDNLKKDYHALWLGRCEPYKNPHIFLEAALNFPSYQFMMVASPATGKEDYFNHIRNRAGNIKNLVFIEYIEHHRVPELINSCKVFVLTADKEGDWPMAVLEAAACGLPLLSYKLNYDLFIDHYRAGYYCHSDIALLYSSLQELLEKEDLYQKMSSNALSYIRDHHDLRANAKQFLAIIAPELIEESRTSHVNKEI